MSAILSSRRRHSPTPGSSGKSPVHHLRTLPSPRSKHELDMQMQKSSTSAFVVQVKDVVNPAKISTPSSGAIPRRHYSSESETTLRQRQRKRHFLSQSQPESQFNYQPQVSKKRSIVESTGVNESAENGSIDDESSVKSRIRAPKNTTQFLITDREERESSDPKEQSECLPRPRCFSSIDQLISGRSDSLDIEVDAEVQDPEFNQVCDDVSMERIEGLSREQVNRELLTTEKDNRHLMDRVLHLKSENSRLKALLEENGIRVENEQQSSKESSPVANYQGDLTSTDQ